MKRLKKDESKVGLSFYQFLPLERLNYEDFRSKVHQRMRVLRKLEQNIKDSETISTMKDDIEGFFCLKLVAVQSKWTSTWFTNMEYQLFKLRCNSSITEARQFFLESFWPNLVNVEKRNESLIIGHDTHYSGLGRNDIIYKDDVKVHFTKCSDIMAKRIYKMEFGLFNFNDDIMISMMASEFRRKLDEDMDILYDRVVDDSDERMIRLNKEIFTGGNQTPTSSTKDVFGEQNLFPLCIQGIIERLQSQKHLKYNDRQTLCLYLKDIGYPLNDCIAYFRSNFNCTLDQFNKEYLYSIRHNYGLEGKRANYTSHTCGKIISSSNDNGSFGCPFVKNIDFVKKSFESVDIEDFGKNPIRCCSKFASDTAKVPEDLVFHTPAEYFRSLMKYIKKE